jgi:hypothetical protein
MQLLSLPLVDRISKFIPGENIVDFISLRVPSDNCTVSLSSLLSKYEDMNSSVSIGCDWFLMIYSPSEKLAFAAKIENIAHANSPMRKLFIDKSDNIFHKKNVKFYKT